MGLDLLDFLRRRYRGDAYKAALVGTYVGGRYVDPPPLQANAYLLMVPLALSLVPLLLSKNAALQWAAGVAIIVGAYLALYLYLRRSCFIPDEVRVVRTNYGDVDYLRRNKLAILEDPSALPGDYEVYHAPAGVCVARDRRANAFTLDGPGGPVIFFTTGLYARLEPEELQAVLEHERGHIRYRHTHKLLAFLIAEYTLRVPLVHLVYTKYTVALLAAHMVGAALLFTALLHAFEFEADRYAAAKHRERLASALVKLDWNGIVDSVANPIAARLSLLARSHPLTIDRLKRLNALPH
ncbi:M48 family metallopeptidase [Pyrobaculum neutrophilum]|uniref:Peptidase M48 Ste24p n=1 Tax=Pyrobaculum neutrophilum (strain DSM 2338 / JCM 9278 / NBRC 100436 / V24Sta) TaxID=444157 RepID=B1YDF9_PYRNV|nr:M48 family metallopeptidase [Pyrobaculum neutrophilum]ACB39822.1 peptidase M48 Ste24p [Pyrobaculum neutrophilum V24Sta]